MGTGTSRNKAQVERERKFLVQAPPRGLSRYPNRLIEQGYLVDEGPVQVRLRRTGRAWALTVKSGSGRSRPEREVALAPGAARTLWPLTMGRRLKKIRYRIPYGRSTIELDIYQGRLRGLMTAEVEFGSAAALRRFKAPAWFGAEVTGRRILGNSYLARHGIKRGRGPRK